MDRVKPMTKEDCVLELVWFLGLCVLILAPMILQ
jgi:hypothetical protein